MPRGFVLWLLGVGGREMGKWGDREISTNTPKPQNPKTPKPQNPTPHFHST
ncbi:hypothetical protein VL20_1843 [Microcystis panniformis FACHB-1757]|uniref:Uncharacterized protein n=1 Tax=Microcystis panniformis FACHB-1757 TaxID=1638788 RepID=A0A0K1RYX5_9CHRO|nr:hypothetical protein VL20_1843 [Microcystis panniformis FACHB-1757]